MTSLFMSLHSCQHQPCYKQLRFAGKYLCVLLVFVTSSSGFAGKYLCVQLVFVTNVQATQGQDLKLKNCLGGPEIYCGK